MLKKTILIICLITAIGVCFLLNTKLYVEPHSVTIQFSTWGSESEIKILEPILQDFEKENPDINVELMHIPQNYFQKLHLLFASNTAPDVVFINNQYLPVYVHAGLLEDLSNDKDLFEFDKFYQKSLDAMSLNQKIYAVPRDISRLVIYYNKELFDNRKVPYPHKNWNYEEFLKTAQLLSDAPRIFGISFEEDPLFYLPYLMSFGLDGIPNYEEKYTIEGLKKYAKLRAEHIAPRKQESASATMAQMFLQGRIAMHLSGRWLVPKYREDAKFDWDVAEFPQGSSGSVVPIDASGWAVAKTSKNKTQAKKLVQYLSSNESIAKFTKSGLIVPARVQIANSKVFLDKQKPRNAEVFISNIETSVPTPVSIDYREVLDKLKSKTETMFNSFND